VGADELDELGLLCLAAAALRSVRRSAAMICRWSTARNTSSPASSLATAAHVSRAWQAFGMCWRGTTTVSAWSREAFHAIKMTTMPRLVYVDEPNAGAELLPIEADELRAAQSSRPAQREQRRVTSSRCNPLVKTIDQGAQIIDQHWLGFANGFLSRRCPSTRA
jgi:hypothetical protein